LTRAHTNPRLTIHTRRKATTPRLNTSTIRRTIPAAATLPTHLRNNTRATKILTSSNTAMANSQDMASTSNKAMDTRRKHTVRHSTASLERLADLQKVIVAWVRPLLGVLAAHSLAISSVEGL
jgi:hypothetical protein